MTTKAVKKIQAKAVECTKNCSCLEPGKKPHCTITGTAGESILFTQTRSKDGCVYQHPFGSSFICTCPVRIELFQKYRI